MHYLSIIRATKVCSI